MNIEEFKIVFGCVVKKSLTEDDEEAGEEFEVGPGRGSF